MNILDETNNETTSNQPTYNSEDTLSEETKKKIQKLTKEDTAQLARNDAYYEKMRKENLNLYRSAKVSEQRFPPGSLSIVCCSSLTLTCAYRITMRSLFQPPSFISPPMSRFSW
jgi:hypothetical protein